MQGKAGLLKLEAGNWVGKQFFYSNSFTLTDATGVKNKIAHSSLKTENVRNVVAQFVGDCFVCQYEFHLASSAAGNLGGRRNRSGCRASPSLSHRPTSPPAAISSSPFFFFFFFCTFSVCFSDGKRGSPFLAHPHLMVWTFR